MFFSHHNRCFSSTLFLLIILSPPLQLDLPFVHLIIQPDRFFVLRTSLWVRFFVPRTIQALSLSDLLFVILIICCVFEPRLFSLFCTSSPAASFTKTYTIPGFSVVSSIVLIGISLVQCPPLLKCLAGPAPPPRRAMPIINYSLWEKRKKTV